MTDMTHPTTAHLPKAWADLINALMMLAHNRSNDVSPFHCEHDALTVMAEPDQFTAEELAHLDELGFFPHSDGGAFTSFRYGSA